MIKSKFETNLSLIKDNFKGPYSLDRFLIEALLHQKSGVYIWAEEMKGSLWGYCGQAKSLPERLKDWARDLKKAQFYYRYVKEEELSECEKYWILKAGDLNKV